MNKYPQKTTPADYIQTEKRNKKTEPLDPDLQRRITAFLNKHKEPK